MCGRTGLSLSKEQIICACSYKPTADVPYCKPDWMHEHNDGREYKPSYNIAPTDVTPVLISASNYTNAARTHRILKPMMWGIIPPWHKGDYRNHNLSTNNCRLEGILGSKLYSPILQDGGRCVIVVEGFYEWQTTNKGSKTKQPYYIFAPQDENVKMDEPVTWNCSYSDEHGWKGVKLLHIAGLYSVWQNEEVIMYSYSVITMESNSTLDWLHHRMPAILDNENQIDVSICLSIYLQSMIFRERDFDYRQLLTKAWLNISDVDPHVALGYLRPVKILSWYSVSTFVNNARNKSAECNKRISLDQKSKSTQKTLTGWFVKAQKRKHDDNTGGEPKQKKN